MLIAALALLTLAPPPKIDACALIPNSEVKRILGAAVAQRQPSTDEARGLLMYQCYLATGTPRSVSIAVAGRAAGGHTETPLDAWRRIKATTGTKPEGGEDEAGVRWIRGLAPARIPRS